MQAVQALSSLYEVHLLTTGDVDLDSLNEWCGTAVTAGEVTIRSARMPSVLGRVASGASLRGAIHQRHCQRLAGEFEVMVSAYNVCDFGVPGIHLIADFSWDEALRRSVDRPPSRGLRSWFHRVGPLRSLYRAAVWALSRPSRRDVWAGDDLILANSRWSAELLAERHGVRVDVLYPPVPSGRCEQVWEDRSEAFLAIGRISEEKRVLEMIDIVEGVRRCGHDVELVIAGEVGETQYCRDVGTRAAAAGEWVSLVGPVVGRAKTRLLAKHKFGLQAGGREAFGIAVAEMVQAGGLVFGPAQGGPAEIIGWPPLLFEDPLEAVDQIDRMLRSPSAMEEARLELSRRAGQFSSGRFAQSVRDVVASYLAR